MPGAPHLDSEMWKTTKASPVPVLACPPLHRNSRVTPRKHSTKNSIQPPTVINSSGSITNPPPNITDRPIYIRNRPNNVTRTNHSHQNQVPPPIQIQRQLWLRKINRQKRTIELLIHQSIRFADQLKLRGKAPCSTKGSQKVHKYAAKRAKSAQKFSATQSESTGYSRNTHTTPGFEQISSVSHAKRAAKTGSSTLKSAWTGRHLRLP